MIELLNKKTIEEVAAAIPFVNLKEVAEESKKTNNAFAIENKLDKYYYEKLFELSKKMTAQSGLFKEFLEQEITLLNIKTILRLKQEGTAPAQIRSYLFTSKNKTER